MEAISWMIVLGCILFAAFLFCVSVMEMFYTESSEETVTVEDLRQHFQPSIINGLSTTTYQIEVLWCGNTYKFDSPKLVFRGDEIRVKITRGKLFSWFVTVEEISTPDIFTDTPPTGFDSPNDWWDSMDKGSQNSLAAKVKKSAEEVTDDEIIFLYVTEYTPPEGEEHHSFAALKAKRANTCKVAVKYTDTHKITRECVIFVPIATQGRTLINQIYTAGSFIHLINSYTVLEHYDGLGNKINEENYYD